MSLSNDYNAQHTHEPRTPRELFDGQLAEGAICEIAYANWLRSQGHDSEIIGGPRYVNVVCCADGVESLVTRPDIWCCTKALGMFEGEVKLKETWAWDLFHGVFAIRMPFEKATGYVKYAEYTGREVWVLLVVESSKPSQADIDRAQNYDTTHPVPGTYPTGIYVMPVRKLMDPHHTAKGGWLWYDMGMFKRVEDFEEFEPFLTESRLAHRGNQSDDARPATPASASQPDA